MLHPENALLIKRERDIPPKRLDKRSITFLTDAEVDALLAACERAAGKDGVTKN